MKRIFILIVLLLLANSALAQNVTNQTTTTTPSGITTAKGIYNFLTSINPLILLIFGLILVIVSKIARFVGIVLIVLALIFLFLSLAR